MSCGRNVPFRCGQQPKLRKFVLLNCSLARDFFDARSLTPIAAGVQGEFWRRGLVPIPHPKGIWGLPETLPCIHEVCAAIADLFSLSDFTFQVRQDTLEFPRVLSNQSSIHAATLCH
jgi:hypothetical protein